MNICVFGASSKTIDEKYIKTVENMGEFLAERGHNLVFGAGRTGLMGAAARGFKKGGGTIHGIVPEFFKKDLSDFVNWNCDKLTLTETMRERKALMEDESDCFIITPGGTGTYEEFFEVLTLKQLGQHRKPIAFYNVDGYFDNVIGTIESAIEKRFAKPECMVLFKSFNELEPMVDYLENDDMEGMTVQDFK